MKHIKKPLLIALGCLLLAGLLLWAWRAWLAPTRIAFVNYQITALGEIAKSNDSRFIKIREVGLDELKRLRRADMVFVNGMGLRITAEQRQQLEDISYGVPTLTTAATNPENYIVSLDPATADTLVRYLSGGGRANYRNLLRYVRRHIDGKRAFTADPAPVVMPDQYRLYHPDLDHPEEEHRGFNTVAAYNQYLLDHYRYADDAPSVVITGQMGDPTDLILALEEAGMRVYAVNAMRSFAMSGQLDSVAPSAIINMAHGRMGDYMTTWLERRRVPLLTTVYVPQLTADWEADPMGMSGGFMSQSIVTPEIDGAIRPYALFAHRMSDEGIQEVYAVPSRLKTFVESVQRYIALQRKPNSEKRVAIYYFKGPGQTSLMASSMEVAPSLLAFLTRLKAEGYRISNLPSTAEELYRRLPVHEGADGQVARLELGNVALIPQPPAGEGDNEFKIVHGTGMAPPQRYIEAYRWAREDFRADAIIHFGTHGSLEYTPRKQVALSDNDWPDRLVGPLPHLYLYTTGNVGEALIAKRRTYASLVSHLTAPFMESGVRNDYRQLSETVKTYFHQLEHGQSADKAAAAVKQMAVQMGLHRPLELDSTAAAVWSEDEITRVDNFAEELSEEKMMGRPYVLGTPYEPQSIESSVYSMCVDPIAYSLLALDKLRGKAPADLERRKSLFSQRYLAPAKQLVRRLLASPATVGDALVCQVAGITAADLAEARRVHEERQPVDMMSMMLSMADEMPGMAVAGKGQQAADSNRQEPPSKMKQFMRRMGRNMKPEKALKMAKMMGASDEALAKMEAAMKGQQAPANAEPMPKGQQHADPVPSVDQSHIERCEAIMEVERTILNVGRYRQLLLASPQAELDALVDALSGRYTPPSPGGDPIVNPNVLPTGRNLYGINAENTPSESAWEKGKLLAENTIRMYRQRHNDSLPQKVSYTLWSGEFIETEGATIAQVLYMLGVEPVRDAFGRVSDLRLIPSADLGRPRIDVCVQTSGQLRDLAASRLFLIDRAVQMAAHADDGGTANHVAEGVRESERRLVESGVSPSEARQVAAYRVFGGVDGSYGTGIQAMVQTPDAYSSDADIAEVYLNNMGAYYGSQEGWEQLRQHAFEAALSGTDAVVQPRQSNTWGALSLDHVYEFMGGLNLAVRHVTGKDPDAYLSDYRNRNSARMQEVKEAIGIESRTTLFNPNYIREQMKGGATAADGFAELVSNTYGWDVMKPKAIDNEMWDEIYDVYIRDSYDLGLHQFFEQQNPEALVRMASTMQTAADKGMWKATSEQLEQLRAVAAQRPAVGGRQQTDESAMRLKKESLAGAEEHRNSLSNVLVVVAVVVAALLAIFALRRRRTSNR